MLQRIKNLLNPRYEISIYRCKICGRIVTDWQIYQGIVCVCGNNLIVQVNPTLIEKIKIILRYLMKGY